MALALHQHKTFLMKEKIRIHYFDAFFIFRKLTGILTGSGYSKTSQGYGRKGKEKIKFRGHPNLHRFRLQ